MTEDLHIRTEGRAGRITLTRPKALNALSHPMALALEAAIDLWREDPAVDLVILDAEGERAFCAGGDIADVYRAGKAGDDTAGRDFWRDEYRMNAKLAEYPKPIIALMQGFVMGGGVGIGCHVSHRVVGDTTQMSMPECGIGLIPDVGGTLLLARAPGQLGRLLGLTGTRMGAGDAIHAGFADHYLPEAEWPALIAELCATGDPGRVAARALMAPASPLAEAAAGIDAAFSDTDIAQIVDRLEQHPEPWASDARKAILRNSPLSMGCTLDLLGALSPTDGIREALTNEFRFTYHAVAQTDFLEGVRAQIIDKDRTPRWRHAGTLTVPAEERQALLAPLGPSELSF
ncbi:enoyl-CoA hydratase/isomerase family protein [Frigidibacter sp.]|uniref:enoyl-CoA hydratase/isomerase family protein n=1 Tax=Frigidibacter sp. TaxID=2586418 RepID=UPI002734BC11|nr:enoyl-CoA hydratase/isomerase family protein [Frigidibacter sp.]MDP3340099.1 enoyl-CoA hydratase/isomerase family protein [Frigidibacter sp.]